MSLRTLTDLPPELLHIILTQLKSSRRDTIACSLTCWRLRGVALEYFFTRRLFAKRIKSPDHLVHFLRTYPRIAQRISELQFSGRLTRSYTLDRSYASTTIDDVMIAKIITLLPNVKSVRLDDFRYAPPLPLPSTADLFSFGPFYVDALYFGGYGHERSSLAGFVRVVSLFAPKALVTSPDIRISSTLPFDPGCIHRPIELQKLSLCSKRAPLAMIEALSKSISSGSLTDVFVNCEAIEDAQALGRLLAQAGENVRLLRLGCLTCRWLDPRGPSPFSPFKMVDKVPAVNIAACKRLQSIVIPMLYDKESQLPIAQFATGLLSQASSTLRTVTIEILQLQRPTAVEDRFVFNLHAVDEVLANEGRFPHLRRVEVRIVPSKRWSGSENYWALCEQSTSAALAGLKARDLLTFTILW